MNKGKYGVLLTNLGTPTAPTTKAVKNYLAKFLSDRRVIDIPKFLWLPILYCIVLPRRSSRIAKLYQSIWLEEGSPLMVYSRRQQQALAKSMIDINIELAMNYGQPSLQDAIARLFAKKITQLIILPLFPQYSSTTSAATWDIIARILTNYRRLPSINFIRDYAKHPAYISALHTSILRTFAQYGKPDKLIISFHSIPMRYANTGDDYPQRCKETIQALATVLKYPKNKLMMTFQSHFGYNSWLLPTTDEVMKLLPNQGVKHVQVICPGFAADCLETLEEIQIKNKKIFIKAGGILFYYIPALNDDISHISLLHQLIQSKLK